MVNRLKNNAIFALFSIYVTGKIGQFLQKLKKDNTESPLKTNTTQVGYCEYELITTDIDTFENSSDNFVATLLRNKKRLENKKIVFWVNGKTYRRKTDKNGVAILPLNLSTGKYDIFTCCNSIVNTNTIIVRPKRLLS